MLKKFTTLAVFLFILLATLPIRVNSAGTEYPLWVGEQQVTSENKSGQAGDGTWSFEGDASGGTLTLNNANITGWHSFYDEYTGTTRKAHIYAADSDFNLTIKSVGQNTMESDSNNYIIVGNSLTITGKGALNLNGGYSIFAENLTIEKADNINIYSGGGIDANNVVISNSSVNMNKEGGQIYATNLTILNSSITQGLRIGAMSLKISGSSVELSAPETGAIGATDIEISNNSVIKAEATKEAISAVNITISDSSVEAFSHDRAGISSMGNLTISGGSLVTSEGNAYYKGAMHASAEITLNDGLEILEPVGGNVYKDAEILGAWIKDAEGNTAARAVIGRNCNITVTANPTSGGTVSGSGEYLTQSTATVTATPSEFYRFVNWAVDGTPISTNSTYSFTVTGDRDLVANFEMQSYTIRFVNEDGTELQSSLVPHGETPVYNGETPTKSADDKYTYTFAGWDSELVPATGDATYTATYTAKAREDLPEPEKNEETTPKSENFDAPDTGDKTSISTWLILIALSLIGLILVYIIGKKRKFSSENQK